MHKLSCVVALLVACGDNLEPPPAELTSAQQAWLSLAFPVLATNCASCHWQPHQDVAFLAGDSDLAMRETLLASGFVELDVPAQSKLLTKGVHQGPYLNAEQQAAIVEWLAVERDAP